MGHRIPEPHPRLGPRVKGHAIPCGVRGRRRPGLRQGKQARRGRGPPPPSRGRGAPHHTPQSCLREVLEPRRPELPLPPSAGSPHSPGGGAPAHVTDRRPGPRQTAHGRQTRVCSPPTPWAAPQLLRPPTEGATVRAAGRLGLRRGAAGPGGAANGCRVGGWHPRPLCSRPPWATRTSSPACTRSPLPTRSGWSGGLDPQHVWPVAEARVAGQPGPLRHRVEGPLSAADPGESPSPRRQAGWGTALPSSDTPH